MDVVCLNIAVIFLLGGFAPTITFFVVRDGTAPPSPGSKPSVLTSILTDITCTRMFHKRLVSPLFYTAPCNHFGTETHIGLGLFNSNFRTLGRILTCNLLLRRELFYTVELRGH